MTTMTTSRQWKYKVVKSQRCGNGDWFRYPTAITTITETDAREYAQAFAADQQRAGVVGTRINVLTRGGQPVAEYRW